MYILLFYQLVLESYKKEIAGNQSTARNQHKN